MAILVPDVGEVELLKRMLYYDGATVTAGNESGTLKIFSNNITPAESDVAGTYTEATFTGYAAKTLTMTQSGSTWSVPATVGGVTSSTYGGGTPLSWSPTSAQVVYGVYVVGATSTTLWWSDLFAASRSLQSGDTLNYTPKVQLD